MPLSVLTIFILPPTSAAAFSPPGDFEGVIVTGVTGEDTGDIGVITVGATEVCRVNSDAVVVVVVVVVVVSLVPDDDEVGGSSTGVSSGLSGWIVKGVITEGTDVPDDVVTAVEAAVVTETVTVVDEDVLVVVSVVVLSKFKLFKFGKPSNPLSS